MRFSSFFLKLLWNILIIFLSSLQLAAKMNSNAVTDLASLQSKNVTVVTIAKTVQTKPILASQNAVLENSVATQANASATAENVTDTLTAAMEVMKMIAVSLTSVDKNK